MTGRFNAGYSSSIELTDASSDRTSILRTPNVDFINESSTLSLGFALDCSLAIALLCSSVVSPSSTTSELHWIGYL